MFRIVRQTQRLMSQFAVRPEDKAHSIKSVGVVGAGQMGIGIAYVAAVNAGLSVKILDSNKEQVEKQMRFIDSLFKKQVEKGRMTMEESEQCKSRISTTFDIKKLQGCDVVIEAVSENVELKLRLFEDLARVVSKKTILATNTSSISITKIASASLGTPERVIGMHFMNPVPVMKLVEIIPGLQTSPETVLETRRLAHAMGKVTSLSDDMPGFIANRLLMPYINESFFALQEGLATSEDIDITMKLGTNMPMGPLTLADFIGLDTCLAIMRVLHSQLGDSKYRPCPLLVKYVDAGRFGKKSGAGVYKY